MLTSAMQLRHQYNSEGGKGLPANENRGTAMPHEDERPRSRASQSQLQQSPVAALRELTQTILHRSSSYGIGSRRKSDGVKQTRRGGDGQSFRRFSESDSDKKRLELEASRYLGHFEQHPFGSRAQAKAKSSCMSPRPYDDSNYTTPDPPLPFVFIKDTVKRSHPPERQNISSQGKGLNLNNLQPPPPLPPRGVLQSTQSLESDAIVDESLLQQPPQFSSNHVKSSHQLRNMCTDIIQSVEEGKSLPPRAQIKEVISEYHRSRNNPISISPRAISPREPNITEVPPQGLARSQTVQQSINDANNDTRRSRNIRNEEDYWRSKMRGNNRRDSTIEC